MIRLKNISKKGVQKALAKAERYRLLNEPKEAESICLDVLAVDPKNPRALVMLLLSLTDQFDDEMGELSNRAKELIERLGSKYERAYYEGIIHERQAKTALRRDTPGNQRDAYEWLQDAMKCFERAESLRPPGNDDAILRWNTCARLINLKKLEAKSEERVELPLE
jgi:hypothetical protein